MVDWLAIFINIEDLYRETEMCQGKLKCSSISITTISHRGAVHSRFVINWVVTTTEQAARWVVMESLQWMPHQYTSVGPGIYFFMLKQLTERSLPMAS